MRLLCVTKNLNFGEAICHGLKPYNLQVNVSPRPDFLYTVHADVLKGVIFGASSLVKSDINLSDFRLPKFLCIDAQRNKTIYDYQFCAIFKPPFNFGEIANVVREKLMAIERQQNSTVLTFKDFELYFGERLLKFEGQKIPLTKKEFLLMEIFFRQPGIVLSKWYLLNQVWGESRFVTTNALEAHIGNLRRKLANIGVNNLINTAHGVGYSM